MRGWHWPAFNVANMAIVGAAIALVLHSIRNTGGSVTKEHALRQPGRYWRQWSSCLLWHPRGNVTANCVVEILMACDNRREVPRLRVRDDSGHDELSLRPKVRGQVNVTVIHRGKPDPEVSSRQPTRDAKQI